ncbi:BTAD domain-containing putative transcriptional regulator [Nocardia yamanashiensis]|uniref:BTAD domain-containing putative transcriptional regulator n=1 Tax=Nocardia yamanashiensis TaxID=209247 RepID=UPI000ABE540E|nr:BTAD domain-containing putative transcriptional regulator [Nocardia yamanashiensis]
MRVWTDEGVPVEIGGVRARMLLARLALERGPVPVPALIDGLWGEDAPADAAGALQALVSRLRKALRGTGTIEFGPGGYSLSAAQVDVARFEELAAAGRRGLLAEADARRAGVAARLLREALGLWRGEALQDVRDAPFCEAVAARLEELRAGAVEDRFEAELLCGRHAEVVADLEAAALAHPLRERLAALRIRALGAAGRQSDALAAYEETRARLDDELGIDPSAELRETQLALLRGELETRTARTESVGSRLPTPLTSFVGRDAELEAVRQRLADSRLVTIVGPGGAGKTRLAVEAMSRFADGPVFFVPLAEIGAPDQLADAVAGALDARSAEPRAERAARLADMLDVGAAVLVLDNCEHLIEAAADLADHLLERLPHLRILATTREPLAITGEALCHLGPLPLPSEAAELDAAQAAPAVRLFLDRATAVRPDFTLGNRTLGPVTEICRRLDGIPLALELAAAKLRAMPIDQIARRLDDRFRLLTSGSRAALPRQRTLHALVEWSWDLLETPERVLARRMSAFPGGATLEALEAICADQERDPHTRRASAAGIPVGDVAYVLGALVEKSLVEVSGADEPRYRMLETIRAYAAGQREAAGESVAAEFGAYYLALAERNEPLLRTGAQLDAIALFDAEHANMVAALRDAMAVRDVESSVRFVRALFWYWGIRGMSTQFEAALTAVLGFGDALAEDVRAALDVVRSLSGASAGAADTTLALIEACTRTGGLEFHPALPLWTAMLAAGVGDAALAERQLDRALDWPDPWVRASTQMVRDIACTGAGDPESGAQARRAALREFEMTGDRWGLAMALLALGREFTVLGDHGRAIGAFERAVAVAAELGTEDDIYATRTELVTARLRAGDFTGAASDIEAARRLAAERGFNRLATVLLFSEAELCRRTGDPEQADRVLDALEARIGVLPFPEPMSVQRIAAARLANRLTVGDAPAARTLLPVVVPGAFEYGDSATIAQTLARTAEQLAELLLLEDDPAGAATALGLGEVIRGLPDRGEPGLVTLRDELTARLGAPGFDAAYREGSGLARAVALVQLAREAQPPLVADRRAG